MHDEVEASARRRRDVRFVARFLKALQRGTTSLSFRRRSVGNKEDAFGHVCKPSRSGFKMKGVSAFNFSIQHSSLDVARDDPELVEGSTFSIVYCPLRPLPPRFPRPAGRSVASASAGRLPVHEMPRSSIAWICGSAWFQNHYGPAVFDLNSRNAGAPGSRLFLYLRICGTTSPACVPALCVFAMTAVA